MKSVKLNKSQLSLNKKTIAKLDDAAIKNIQGGGTSTSCNIVINISKSHIGGSIIIKF